MRLLFTALAFFLSVSVFGQIEELGRTIAIVKSTYGPPCQEGISNIWYCTSDDRIRFQFENGIVTGVVLMYAPLKFICAQQALDSRYRQLRNAYGKEDRYEASTNMYSWVLDDTIWSITTSEKNGTYYNSQSVSIY